MAVYSDQCSLNGLLLAVHGLLQHRIQVEKGKTGSPFRCGKAALECAESGITSGNSILCNNNVSLPSILHAATHKPLESIRVPP